MANQYVPSDVIPEKLEKLAKVLASDDNWKHRSDRMTCLTCMWFVIKVTRSGSTDFGRCRKHAPTLGGWPAVFGSDWCGDHKLDENKI